MVYGHIYRAFNLQLINLHLKHWPGFCKPVKLMLAGESNNWRKADKAMSNHILVCFKSSVLPLADSIPPSAEADEAAAPSTCSHIAQVRAAKIPSSTYFNTWLHFCWVNPNTCHSAHIRLISSPCLQPSQSQCGSNRWCPVSTDIALSKTADQIWANRGTIWQLSTSCHVLVAFIIQYYILWNRIHYFKVQFDILVKKKKKSIFWSFPSLPQSNLSQLQWGREISDSRVCCTL